MPALGPALSCLLLHGWEQMLPLYLCAAVAPLQLFLPRYLSHLLRLLCRVTLLPLACWAHSPRWGCSMDSARQRR